MITLSDIECMKKCSLVNRGNQSRLKREFRKMEKGEKVTIGFFGGSITEGYCAEPMEENGYAAQTASWFYDMFSKEQIHYVNAGIGATDSYLGVHRVEKDLLSYKPDIVVIEFSVNDDRALNKESYDSLIRKVYQSEKAPAVILLFITRQNGVDYQLVHEEIGNYYDLPMISYRNAVLPYLESGSLPWSLIGSNNDDTHPSNMGHFLIASFLIEYFGEVYEHRMEEEEEGCLKPPLTSDPYQDARMYDNTNLLPTEAHEFEPLLLKEAQFPHGWRTVTGGSISFYLTGKNIGMIFFGTKDDLSGRFDVLVDGEKMATVDADFIGRWGSYAEYIELMRSEQEQLHKVEIKKADDSVRSQFTILGFTVS